MEALGLIEGGWRGGAVYTKEQSYVAQGVLLFVRPENLWLAFSIWGIFHPQKLKLINFFSKL